MALLTTLVTSSPRTTVVKTDHKTAKAHSSRKGFSHNNTVSPYTVRYIRSLMLIPPSVTNSNAESDPVSVELSAHQEVHEVRQKQPRR